MYKIVRKIGLELTLVLDPRESRPINDVKKGQCFRCGDKCYPAHQCKNKTFHSIEGELAEEDDSDEDEIIVESSPKEGCNEGEVTFNAITCYSPLGTLKLLTNLNNKEIHVIIDSGSTNNFIDPKVLQKVQIQSFLGTFI